jgi:predicted dehydrogenase
MAPIKVGFLGLSASGWASHAHLPYMKDNGGEYEIVAVQSPLFCQSLWEP